MPTCSILLGSNCRCGASHLHETTSVGSAALAKASNLLQPVVSKRDRRESELIVRDERRGVEDIQYSPRDSGNFAMLAGFVTSYRISTPSTNGSLWPSIA